VLQAANTATIPNAGKIFFIVSVFEIDLIGFAGVIEIMVPVVPPF
jgi:predicted permease